MGHQVVHGKVLINLEQALCLLTAARLVQSPSEDIGGGPDICSRQALCSFIVELNLRCEGTQSQLLLLLRHSKCPVMT